MEKNEYKESKFFYLYHKIFANKYNHFLKIFKMSQRTFVSFYIKKNQRDDDRISSFLSGSSSTKAKKRTSVSTPATAEALTSRSSVEKGGRRN